MTYTVRLGNCFLSATLMYRPLYLVPCCHCKRWELTKMVNKSYSSLHFVSQSIICCDRRYLTFVMRAMIPQSPSWFASFNAFNTMLILFVFPFQKLDADRAHHRG